MKRPGKLGIPAAAQNVHFGTLSFEDDVTITPDEFYGRLSAAAEPLSTSQASPARFKDVYDEPGGRRRHRLQSHLVQDQRRLQLGPPAPPATPAVCSAEVIDPGQASASSSRGVFTFRNRTGTTQSSQT